MSPRRPLRLAGAILGKSRHTCALFNSKDEEYEVLLPFIKDGLEDGDKAFHIIDPDRRESHLGRLAKAGIDVEAARQSGQLEVKAWQDAYLRGDRFDQYRMLELIQEVLDAGKTQGYLLTRLVANMEWALIDLPGVHDLVEYETRLNYILPRYDDPVTWTYDATKFGGQVVMDIMRTHPMVIVGGLLQENPFFVPPDEFLQELQARA